MAEKTEIIMMARREKIPHIVPNIKDAGLFIRGSTWDSGLTGIESLHHMSEIQKGKDSSKQADACNIGV